MKEIRLGFDHAFQQAFHLIHPIQPLSHHGQFIAQFQVIGCFFGGAEQDLVSLFIHLVVTQQFHFRLQTGALGLRRDVGQLLNQGAGLADLAATGQQIGALYLHLR